MKVTAAAIRLAHNVVEGTDMPADLSFALYGNALVFGYGQHKADKFLNKCQQVLDQNPGVSDYSQLAKQVPAI